MEENTSSRIDQRKRTEKLENIRKEVRTNNERTERV